MQARESSTCIRCNKPIEVGQSISWNRRNYKGKYHVDCAMPDKPHVMLGTHRIDSDTPDSDVARAIAELKPEAKPEPKKAFVPLVQVNPATLQINAPWHTVFAAVLPFTNRVLLIGPPSSGKSTTAMLTAGIHHRITMTETTSREDLIGMFHLIKAETVWVDGPITSAMRNGEPVLIDEIDRYSPEAASLLYSLIDDKPHITLPTGEIVSAADGYKVVMTSNEGLDTLPPAVQDRIEVIIMAQQPHPNALANLPKAQANVVSRWYTIQPVPQLKLFPTVRRMRAFHKLVSASVPSNIAANLVFGIAGSLEVLSAITSAEGNF